LKTWILVYQKENGMFSSSKKFSFHF